MELYTCSVLPELPLLLHWPQLLCLDIDMDIGIHNGHGQWTYNVKFFYFSPTSWLIAVVPPMAVAVKRTAPAPTIPKPLTAMT